MHKTKKALLFVIFFFLPLFLSTAQEKILIVTEAWPPFVIQEGNTPSGFDYEVMLAVFQKMNYQVDFKFYPWKRCIEMIKTKKAHAILDISINDERLEYIYFPDEKISDSESVLFYKKGRKFTFNSLHDLTNYKVGTTHGYSYSEEFDNATHFIKEPAKDISSNFKKLVGGRIHLFICNKNVGLYELKKMGLLKEVDYLPKAVTGSHNYVGFSMMSGHDELAKKFSQELRAFKKTNTYKKILAKYGQ
ncbi:MAG: transporter substrate-binding domain-containing protein [Spirochaetes bacterium]|nr:transporter substrate-binding domain-containing protein [Spirochaetota bacterium]